MATYLNEHNQEVIIAQLTPALTCHSNSDTMVKLTLMISKYRQLNMPFNKGNDLMV